VRFDVDGLKVFFNAKKKKNVHAFTCFLKPQKKKNKKNKNLYTYIEKLKDKHILKYIINPVMFNNFIFLELMFY
jgi:hypothetical protein